MTSYSEAVKFVQDNILSSRETAEFLGISTSRLATMVRTGKMRVVRKQPVLFLKSDVLNKKNELEELRIKFRPYDQ